MCEMAKNKSVRCNFSGNNFTCPFRCDEFKRSCNAKCVKLDEGPKERKKKKKPDPNEDLRLMPQIQRVAEIEGCLNQSRFSELMLYYVNQNLDKKALESLFKAFDFDKGGIKLTLLYEKEDRYGPAIEKRVMDSFELIKEL